MNMWAMIPMKPFSQAKTRLSAVLTEPERAALAAAMLRQVLRVVVSQRRYVGRWSLAVTPMCWRWLNRWARQSCTSRRRAA